MYFMVAAVSSGVMTGYVASNGSLGKIGRSLARYVGSGYRLKLL